MRPSTELLAQALAAAEQLRVSDEDLEGLAECFIYLHHRNQELEKVFEHTDRFLRFGMAEDEHARLRRILDQIRYEDRHEADQDTFGLE